MIDRFPCLRQASICPRGIAWVNSLQFPWVHCHVLEQYLINETACHAASLIYSTRWWPFSWSLCRIVSRRCMGTSKWFQWAGGVGFWWMINAKICQVIPICLKIFRFQLPTPLLLPILANPEADTSFEFPSPEFLTDLEKNGHLPADGKNEHNFTKHWLLCYCGLWAFNWLSAVIPNWRYCLS